MSKPFSVADLAWMDRALVLARRGEGLTSPNPCVGAVLVRGGRMIGEGWHARAGGPHAEVAAVAAAKRRGQRVAGSTLYVTLEPCCTHGRTPPCTDLILREKIARVVVAATDPNPHHAGKGYRILRRAGVAVTTGVRAEESNALNRDFNHWVTTGKPWVILKMAMGLDGNTAPAAGKSPWVSGPQSRRRVQEMRFLADAIVIGAGTARLDNPRLTVRLPGKKKEIQPWRVVLTRSGRLPANLRLLTDAHRARTLVYQNKSWAAVLRDLGKRGVKRVLVEGGGTLAGSALAAGVVDEMAFFIAPLVVGNPSPAVVWPGRPGGRLALREIRWEKVGRDQLCTALLERVAR